MELDPRAEQIIAEVCGPQMAALVKKRVAEINPDKDLSGRIREFHQKTELMDDSSIPEDPMMADIRRQLRTRTILQGRNLPGGPLCVGGHSKPEAYKDAGAVIQDQAEDQSPRVRRVDPR